MVDFSEPRTRVYACYCCYLSVILMEGQESRNINVTNPIAISTHKRIPLHILLDSLQSCTFKRSLTGIRQSNFPTLICVVPIVISLVSAYIKRDIVVDDIVVGEVLYPRASTKSLKL
jgi:hypothetical protein